MFELAAFVHLQRLESVPLPVLVSPDVVTIASGLATRFERAYTFLATLLSVKPEVRLLVLSPADWANYAHPAFPLYGLTHYDPARRLIITGVEVGADRNMEKKFRQSLAQAQLHEVTQVYGLRDGQLDLTAHLDTYLVHDLGHAFHLHANYCFPRRWLMEYFADLCAYTYLAACEPEQLSALATFPRALKSIGAEQWLLHTWADFDAYYGKSEMSVENYLWFHGHLFAVAQQEYGAAGQQALQQMWQTFVLGNIQEVSDEQLTAILKPIQPYLAQLLIGEVSGSR